MWKFFIIPGTRRADSCSRFEVVELRQTDRCTGADLAEGTEGTAPSYFYSITV